MGPPDYIPLNYTGRMFSVRSTGIYISDFFRLIYVVLCCYFSVLI